MQTRRNFTKSAALFCASGTLVPGLVLRPAPASARTLKNNMHIRAKVYNRGRAPVPFLNTLIDWAATAPDDIFTPNKNYDVYSHVRYRLGPWTGLRHRKAAMLEVLRVLGGFESSWKWTAGVDIGKTEPNTACREEAGLFQCSGNSMNFDKSPVRTTLAGGWKIGLQDLHFNLQSQPRICG